MPGSSELIGFLIAIFVIWILLKVARVAIRLILFVVTVILLVGTFWWFLMR